MSPLASPATPALLTLSVVDAVLLVAEAMDGIEEAPGHRNSGRAVERIQRRTGNKRGDAWCASYVAEAGARALGRRWPLPLTASCDELLKAARALGVVADHPLRGDVFLVMRTKDDAIHTGFVTKPLPAGPGAATRTAFATVEGNTNPGGGREGYGVFPRTRGEPGDPSLRAGYTYLFVRWPAVVR